MMLIMALLHTASDLKAIKKAYKTMSLKLYPDKKTNNPAAEAKFMMVAKAAAYISRRSGTGSSVSQ